MYQILALLCLVISLQCAEAQIVQNGNLRYLAFDYKISEEVSSAIQKFLHNGSNLSNGISTSKNLKYLGRESRVSLIVSQGEFRLDSSYTINKGDTIASDPRQIRVQIPNELVGTLNYAFTISKSEVYVGGKNSTFPQQHYGAITLLAKAGAQQKTTNKSD